MAWLQAPRPVSALAAQAGAAAGADPSAAAAVAEAWGVQDNAGSLAPAAEEGRHLGDSRRDAACAAAAWDSLRMGQWGSGRAACRSPHTATAARVGAATWESFQRAKQAKTELTLTMAGSSGI
jgi:hypothetical protein